MKYLLIIISLTTNANVIWADEGVDITDPIQVSELHNLQDKLDSVSTAIMGCMDAGGAHKTCMCKHKEQIVQFNTIVSDLFSNHPGFEQLDIVRFRIPGGQWVSQSLKGIRKQAGVEPSCN